MFAESLTDHLRQLRAQAGAPSVRQLERLTAQQGPRRRMGSSTINDKLNGKSPLRLEQLLTLVQACADYAQAVGVPLPRAVLDQELWRKRLESAPARGAMKSPELKTSALPVAPPPAGHLLETPDLMSPEWKISLLPWSVDPLRSAGMEDMVELVESSFGQPMANWLPRVLDALAIAGMSYEAFLEWASQQSVREIVALIEEMGDSKENPVLTRLLFHASKNQEAGKVPSLVVALRRSTGEYFDGHALAERLISFISGKNSGQHIGSLRRDCVPVIAAFRSATLMSDASRIVREIGLYRSAVVISAVEASGGPDARDGDMILASVARGSIYHLVAVLKELRDVKFSDEAKRQYLTHIARGVSTGKHVETADLLEIHKLGREAHFFREMKDAPPF